MKRFFVFMAVVIVALLPMISTPSSSAQNDNGTRYMFYFSEVFDSFVIEQADGNNPRLFGAEMMPADPVFVGGPGWSPSGEWFAWEAGYGGFREREYLTFALNVDGTRQLSGLEDYASAEVDWSPISDQLVVSGFVGTPQVTEAGLLVTTVRTQLIDATTDTVMFRHDIPDYVVNFEVNSTAPIQLVNPPPIFWMPDGQHFVIELTRFIPNENGSYAARNAEIIYQVYDLAGPMHQIAQIEDNIISEAVSRQNGLRSGKFVYSLESDPTTLVFADLIANETTEMDTDLNVYRVAFSPDGINVLLHAEDADCETDCPNSLWLWRGDVSTLSLVYDNTEWPFLTPSSIWSPDGHYAMVITADSGAVLLDVDNGVIQTVEGVTEANYWQWTDDGQLLLGLEGFVGTIYQINLSSNSVEHVFSRHIANGLYEIGKFAPNGSSFAYVGMSPIIQDVESGEEIFVRSDGRSFLTQYGGEVYWSADGEWILLAEDGLVAGGGAPRWTGVMRRDGSMRRELGQNGSPRIFGWLPERVDVSQLPAALPEPLFPTPFRSLHAPNWSFVISWSPDGTQLVRGEAFADRDTPTEFTLFNVETGLVISELAPLELGEQTVEWTENADGMFSPQFVDHAFGEWQDAGTLWGTSPDGSRVAVFDDNMISIVGNRQPLHIYDAETNELLHSIEGLVIPSFSFTPDNSLLVVSSPYSNTRIYDGETWEVLFTFNTHATAVAFSPDGETLAVANSWDIELYDVDEILGDRD